VSAPETESPRRRIPKQARARERVGRILDAARRELEAQPVAEITIEGIAERAGVPVGSVYQYFSSKTALLVAVAETVMDEADSETARQLVDCRTLPWRDAVDRTVGATLRFLGESFGYRQLLRTIRFTTEFMEVTATSNERVADLMSLHPAFGRAGISRAQALDICRVVVTAGNALQDRALADEQPDFAALVEETQRLVKGYLGTYLP
jgi:AcrR family transcriptional regulator